MPGSFPARNADLTAAIRVLAGDSIQEEHALRQLTQVGNRENKKGAPTTTGTPL